MNHKNIIWIIGLLVISSASAIPIPLGLDGRIYELDGITEVFSGVPVIINDTTSNIVIYTTTGKISSGRYSVALNGQKDDLIIVTAYNPLHESSRSINLDGVIHDFDLLLNMSLPPFPPNITSIPGTSTLEDELYTYSLKTFDWNNDKVTYSLVESPEGMVLNNNIIYWIPKDENVGNNTIKVSASDGSLNGYQEYVLEVINANDPPNITSIPVTKATAGKPYEYTVIASDPDEDLLTYSVISFPTGMSINSNVITWNPENVGVYNVVIQVSDGELTTTQEYEIEVGLNSPPEIISNPATSAIVEQEYTYSIQAVDADEDDLTYSLVNNSQGMTLSNNTIKWTPQEKGKYEVEVGVSDGIQSDSQSYEIKVKKKSDGKKTASGSGGIKFSNEQYTEEQTTENGFVEQKTGESEESKDVKVRGGGKAKKLRSKPKDISSPDRLVYSYLEIERTTKEGKAIIEFKVDKEWLSDRKVQPEDIILARYTKNWEELPTQNTDQDNQYAYYEAETPGFSYFAITIRKGSRSELPDPDIKIIEEPFVVFGKVLSKRGREVEKGTQMIIENLATNELIYYETGGASKGNFQFVVHGAKGDKIKINVVGFYKAELELKLNQSKTYLEIKTNNSGGLLGISGRAISTISGRNVSRNFSGIISSVIILLLLGYLIFSYFRYKKKTKPNEPENLVEKVDSGNWGGNQ